MIDIVKAQLDVGCITGREETVAFWRDEIGLPFDGRLPVGRGQVQHRFDERGSIVKVNVVEGGPGTQRSGIEEVLLARDELGAPEPRVDPDGNAVRLVPSGFDGVTQLGVRIGVRALDRTMAHYRDVLGFEPESAQRVRCGDTVLLFEERPDAPSGYQRADRGWTYLTVQVRSCDAETERVAALGAEVALPPTTLGEVARISMVRDPDGNWLEISQRASLVGTLEPA